MDNSTGNVNAGSTDRVAREDDYPNETYAWYVVGVLVLAYTVSYIDRTILTLMVGPIRATLGISDVQISLLHGLAFAIFYTVLGLPLGEHTLVVQHPLRSCDAFRSNVCTATLGATSLHLEIDFEVAVPNEAAAWGRIKALYR